MERDDPPRGSKETPMNCAHGGCYCRVDAGTRFCSRYCQEHADHADHRGDHRCDCGHDACAIEATV
jgi:hypothetical protein